MVKSSTGEIEQYESHSGCRPNKTAEVSLPLVSQSVVKRIWPGEVVRVLTVMEVTKFTIKAQHVVIGRHRTAAGTTRARKLNPR